MICSEGVRIRETNMSKKSKKSNIPKIAQHSAQPIQTNPAPTVNMPSQPTVNEKTQLTQLINNLEQARGNIRVIIYWLLDTARISEAVVTSLYDQLSNIGKQPALDLVLFTRGGDTEALTLPPKTRPVIMRVFR